MNYLTNQQILNKVSKHLIKQNAQAKVGGTCKYRFGDKSCAVGCLIPDKYYTKSIEGNTLEDISPELEITLKKSGIRKSSFKLLGALQTVHDQHTPDAWKEFLLDTAKEFKLKPTKVLQ